MILILLGLSIALSIVSEWASELIYFVKIRRKLTEANMKPSFDWLPHKRKALVSKYIRIIAGNKTDLIWGHIVVWLYYKLVFSCHSGYLSIINNVIL